MSTEKATLGCYMIVKNEESTIKTCLDSIYNICDEIVIVDTGCSDKTIEVAKSLGDKIKVYDFEWCNDFSAARNFAMSKVSADYYFTTDADEEFTPNLIDMILSLKSNGFYGADSYEMWLLNYNGPENSSFYLGGRQIVKRKDGNAWRYKIHEKLYFEGGDIRYIDKNDGYILHKHAEKPSDSNYPKYAETYYNEINGGEIYSQSNGAHFFYYMFMTLKEIDIKLAKWYLKELFDEKRILSNSENQIVNMLVGNYISLEEFAALNAIHDNNRLLLPNLADALSEETAKFLLLKKSYDNGEHLSESDVLSYSFASYMNADVKTFSRMMHDYANLYRHNGTILHNINFCEEYVDNAIDRTLVIDCTKGTAGLPSNIYYFKNIFNTIKIKCDRDKLKHINTNGCEIVDNYDEGVVVDGNQHMYPKKALEIFDSVMQEHK